ncbi:MAG: hypothetical protein PHF17_06650 [Arcobacteraceae bacterium]|nr:hypothetical protein [Arcobacteraceae bacterium]
MLKIVGTLTKISASKDKGILHISNIVNFDFIEITEFETIEIPLKKLSKYKNKINQTISVDVAIKIVYIGI